MYTIAFEGTPEQKLLHRKRSMNGPTKIIICLAWQVGVRADMEDKITMIQSNLKVTRNENEVKDAVPMRHESEHQHATTFFKTMMATTPRLKKTYESAKKVTLDAIMKHPDKKISAGDGVLKTMDIDGDGFLSHDEVDGNFDVYAEASHHVENFDSDVEANQLIQNDENDLMEGVVSPQEQLEQFADKLGDCLGEIPAPNEKDLNKTNEQVEQIVQFELFKKSLELNIIRNDTEEWATMESNAKQAAAYLVSSQLFTQMNKTLGKGELAKKS